MTKSERPARLNSVGPALPAVHEPPGLSRRKSGKQTAAEQLRGDGSCCAVFCVWTQIALTGASALEFRPQRCV